MINLFFSRNHISPLLIIHSSVLQIQLFKAIGFVVSFADFGIGIIVACFQELGMFLLCQMLLKIWSKYWSKTLGSCFKNSYGISSGPGVVL